MEVGKGVGGTVSCQYIICFTMICHPYIVNSFKLDKAGYHESFESVRMLLVLTCREFVFCFFFGGEGSLDPPMNVDVVFFLQIYIIPLFS